MKILLKFCFLILFGFYFSNVLKGQATIGSRDGISYIITGKEYINEPNASRCGYNDAGFPITARTTVEVRDYEEYKEGKFIRRWTEKVKTETICLE